MSMISKEKQNFPRHFRDFFTIMKAGKLKCFALKEDAVRPCKISQKFVLIKTCETNHNNA